MLSLVWVLAGVVVPLSAQEPATDDELSRHLTTVRAQVEDQALNIARREELVLEMAGTLDRAAQALDRPGGSPSSLVGRDRAAGLVLEREYRPPPGAAAPIPGRGLSMGPSQ